VDPGEDRDEPETLENIPVADNDHNPPTNPPMQFAPPPDPFPDPDVGPPEPTNDVEVEPLLQPATEPIAAPPADTPTPTEPVAPTQNPEIPGVRKSTRVRVQTKPQYQPSFNGKKYEVAASQLDFPDILHPDSHLIFSQLTEEIAPEAVAIIMTQLSLRAGLREWGGKAKDSV
jgi:hypothetical protein